MKVAVCLLLCLCILQIDFSSGQGRRFNSHRCGSHHRRNRFRHRHNQDPCVDEDQGGNTNGENNLGNVETSSPSTGGRRPGYGNVQPYPPPGGTPDNNRYGNVQPYPPPGGTPDNNRYGNVEPYSRTGGSRPGYNSNGDVETSSPPTGLTGPGNNANGTVVPVPDGANRRLIQVGSNCPPGYRGDSRGNCREDF